MEKRNYLIQIEFETATPERLANVAPRILEALADIAGKEHELVFRSLDRSVIAYFVHTPRHATSILNRLKFSSDRLAAELRGAKFKDWGHAVLGGNDKISVVELGKDYAAYGYGRLAGWINGHQS